jgi:hypothetical protein
MLSSPRIAVDARAAAEAEHRIRMGLEQNVRYFAHHPGEIAHRLVELDTEWSLERALEAKGAALAFIGTALGLTRSRLWFVLPAAVSVFLFQHAARGWCGPATMLRRFGLRTAREIETERLALKYLRGDFVGRPGDPDPAGPEGGRALRAAQS